MLIEFLIAGILGIFTGVLVGLLPGLGAAAVTLMLYPFLINFSLAEIFIFYLALMNSTQYYGSISATVFGVSGEVSSLPAVRHGHQLFLNGQGNQALCYASTGSFFAALIGILMFVAIAVAFYSQFVFMLKGSVVLSLLSVALAIILLTSNKKIAAVIFGVLGAAAGQVGYNDLLDIRFLTFGIPQLDGGLSLFPIFCGLIIVPILLQQHRLSKSSSVPNNHRVSFKTRLRLLFDLQYWPSICRGGVIGFFVGLIPGCSYTVSSNIVDSVEGKLVGEDQKLKRLVAAEAANNSGSVSVLIPMLILAIPIVFSEAIILGIAESKGFGYTNSIEVFGQYFWPIVIVLISINLLNWVLSGVFYNAIIQLYRLISKYVYLIVFVISLVMMFWLGYQEHRFWFYVVSFVVSLIFGLLTIKYDNEKFVFVYTYFVSTIMSDEIYRQFLI
jgi:putative tricarboxylic transport membrane protein